MVSFDLEKFASMKGEGQGLLDSVGSSFGVPSCLMNLAKDALGALPMGMLQDILGSAKEGKADALDYINEITEDFFLKSGILQMASEGGVWKFISDSLAWGFDDDKLKGLGDVGKWLGYVDAVVELGGELYKNLSFAWEQIKDMKECISGYMDFLSMDEGVPGPPPNKDAEAFKEFLDNEFADVQQQRLGAEAFIIDADRLISDVQSIIKERQANPNLEPIFFDVPEIAGSDFPTQLPEDLEEVESLFDLVFGPPKSTEGQFLLTADGLLDLYAAVATDYARNGTFVFNRTTLGAIRKLQDSSGASAGVGSYVFMTGLQAGIPNTILGQPYIEAADMADVGAGTKPVAFGDFRRGYMIVDRINLSVLRDPYTQAASGTIRYIARRRVGGQVILAEAIRLQNVSA